MRATQITSALETPHCTAVAALLLSHRQCDLKIDYGSVCGPSTQFAGVGGVWVCTQSIGMMLIVPDRASGAWVFGAAKASPGVLALANPHVPPDRNQQLPVPVPPTHHHHPTATTHKLPGLAQHQESQPVCRPPPTTPLHSIAHK